jgi:hypothetical protein
MTSSIPVPPVGYFMPAQYVVADYLRSVVPANYTVVTLVPADPSKASPIIVCRTLPMGSVYNLVLSKRRVCVWCYNTSEQAACQDAETVRGWLVNGQYVSGSHIRGVNFVAEPAYFPDPDDPGQLPRAQLVCDVLLKSTVAPPSL